MNSINQVVVIGNIQREVAGVISNITFTDNGRYQFCNFTNTRTGKKMRCIIRFNSRVTKIKEINY